MSETISWSLSAGASISATGSTPGDATISLSKELDAASGETALTLQVDDVDKVTFLSITADLLDGSVTAKGTGDDAIALTGPMLLFGEAAKLFADDLTTLAVENKSADKKAKLSVLIGLSV